MTIQFKCQHCQSTLTVPEDQADRAVQCECGKWVVARRDRGRFYRAVSHALNPMALLGREKKAAKDAVFEEPEPEPESVHAGNHIHLDKSLLVIAPPDGIQGKDWSGLISKHVMSGEVDEATAYAYTRQAKEAHDDGRHAEALDLFETGRDCYGQYCHVLTQRVTEEGTPATTDQNERTLGDLERCMYNFAVLICATRLPTEDAAGRQSSRDRRMLFEELALAARILSRPKEFWNCTVVFSRNKEQLLNEIGRCFERYEMKLSDFL
ncbi:MAG: hypothetical protein GXP25_11750 [Planctomycetes bacterium]|nr:hypothetical protein [Planctomycetota bacterium]